MENKEVKEILEEINGLKLYKDKFKTLNYSEIERLQSLNEKALSMDTEKIEELVSEGFDGKTDDIGDQEFTRISIEIEKINESKEELKKVEGILDSIPTKKELEATKSVYLKDIEITELQIEELEAEQPPIDDSYEEDKEISEKKNYIVELKQKVADIDTLIEFIPENFVKKVQIQPAPTTPVTTAPTKPATTPATPVTTVPTRPATTPATPVTTAPTKPATTPTTPVTTAPTKPATTPVAPVTTAPTKPATTPATPVTTAPTKPATTPATPVTTAPTKPATTPTTPVTTVPTRPATTPPSIPISRDTIKILLDASTGYARIDRRQSGVLSNDERNLETLMNSKKEKEIRKDIVRQFKEEKDKKYAKNIRKLKRKINPVVLELINGYTDGLDIIRQYIDAVKEGDKDKLPFDEYNINLNGGVTISEKSFTRLNRYAVRDNKNLGTEFNATKWYTIKKALNKILPKKLPLAQKWREALPGATKLKRQNEIDNIDKKYEKAKKQEKKALKLLRKAKTPEDKAEARKILAEARDNMVRYNRGGSRKSVLATPTSTPATPSSAPVKPASTPATMTPHQRFAAAINSVPQALQTTPKSQSETRTVSKQATQVSTEQEIYNIANEVLNGKEPGDD